MRGVIKGNKANNSGFTLIELILGIVVFSIVILIASRFLSQQSVQTADPMIRVRAAELGQAFISEISAKAFDEVNVANGGAIRCGTTGEADCTVLSNPTCSPTPTYFSDTNESGTQRSDYDDVDDYHCRSYSGNEIYSLSGQLPNLYDGFTVSAFIIADGNTDGIADGSSDIKLIKVVVTASNGEDFTFSRYRYNY